MLFDSIFARGLLIPGQGNELRVLHGSACGLGIYTTKPESAATSRAYCDAPRMLVCGVLDTDGPAIAHYPWGRVIFDTRLVAPLFEAAVPGWQQSLPVTTPAAKLGRVQPRVLPVNPPTKTRARKARVSKADGPHAFLARRAAQKRRT